MTGLTELNYIRKLLVSVGSRQAGTAQGQAQVMLRLGAEWVQVRWRRLDIPTGQQTYRAIKVKLMLLLTNDQKTKNEAKYNEDFLFKHILIHIILY